MEIMITEQDPIVITAAKRTPIGSFQGALSAISAPRLGSIAIKTALGKIDFHYSPEDIAQAAMDTGFIELPVSAVHGAKVAHLPLHHRDPFDRLLIAQVLLMPAQLFTADAALVPYSELVRLV